jgi:hypothetical protein
MENNTAISKNEKELLRGELEHYLELNDDLTLSEFEKLKEWVLSGNSVHENPYLLSDESGCPMDYIEAIRCYEEDAINRVLYDEYLLGESVNADTDSFSDCSFLLDISNVYGRFAPYYPAADVVIDLGIRDNSPINSIAAAFSINTQSNRRETIKAIIICLSFIRDAEKKYLDEIPEWLQETVFFETGENAVDALDEIIDLLNDIY